MHADCSGIHSLHQADLELTVIIILCLPSVAIKSHHCLTHDIAYKGAQYPMMLAITSYCMSFLDLKVSFSFRNNALRNKYAQDHIFSLFSITS